MTSILRRTTAATGVVSAILLVVAGTTGPSEARAVTVRASGDCSARSTWDLKAKADDGRLEVEAEIDTPKAHRAWTVRLTDNGHMVLNTTRRTTARSGSFTVHAHPANRAGIDRIRFVARNRVNGERCVGIVRFPG